MALAAGESHSLALLSNGTVVGWGSNSEGQAQPPADLHGVIAIAGGGYHSLALLSNGRVVGWGNNDYGQTIPPPIAKATAISAGKFYSVALQQDGNFTSWGYDITKNAPLEHMPGLVGWPSGGIGPESSMSCSSRIGTTMPRIPDPTNITLQFLEEVHKIRVKWYRNDVWPYYALGLGDFSDRLSYGLADFVNHLKNGEIEKAETKLLVLRYRHEDLVKCRVAADKLLQIANRRLQGADVSASANEWTKEFAHFSNVTAMHEENFWKNLPAGFREKLEELEASFEDKPEREEDCEGVKLMRTYGKFKAEWDADAKIRSKPKSLDNFFKRLDATQDKAELSKRKARKMGAVAFILVNQAMWNFDGISPDEYQLILDMTKDWDRRLEMKLREADHINLVQWAINKWNEDAQNQNHDNYEAIVGNLCIFNRFERPIVPAQLHKVGDLDGGITAEQLQFIHDIETYLNTEGLVEEEDETRMNTDQAVCYILLVMALWDDDGFTQEEQGAVAEIMGNFSIGLPLETLTVMLEENVEHYQRDDANKDIKHLENCMEQATSQLSDIWKQWLIESLQHLAEVGGTTDQRQKGFMKLLPKQLGLEKEPEKVAA